MKFLVLLAALLLAGCIPVPYAPKSDVLASTTELGVGVSLHFMNKSATGLSHRNLIFIAADDESEAAYSKFIKEAYPLRSTPRLEEVAWWLYASAIRDLYDRVIRIRYDRFNTQNLVYALQYMEGLGETYDLALLTHGVPNNIITSVGNPIFTWQELDALQGKFPKLRLVFMQGCFGSSLAKDWEQAGAKAVLSFPDLNRNFFYYGFYLEHLRDSPDDLASAYQHTNSSINSELEQSDIYNQLVEVLGVTMEEYLQTAPNPELTQ